MRLVAVSKGLHGRRRVQRIVLNFLLTYRWWRWLLRRECTDNEKERRQELRAKEKSVDSFSSLHEQTSGNKTSNS